MRRLLSALVCLLGLVTPGARAQIDTRDAYLTLKGIDTVAVTFTGLKSDYRRLGVDEGAMRERIEQRLRDAGLAVVSEDEAARTPGAALIRTDVRVNITDYHLYSYSVSLKVRQKIPLPASAESFISETIWTEGVNRMVQESDLDRMNRDFEDLVSVLLQTHAAQNPGR
jgi:hypothetical protein